MSARAVVADRALWVACALLFAASAALAIAWCGAMAAMRGMPMPGGWIMSMAWMRMPGQTWPGAAASFLGMWSAMMVAMMLPVLAPWLRHYRRALDARRDLFTLCAGLGYFAVWIVLGAAIYPLGVALAAVAMASPTLSRIAPLIFGALLLGAGFLQFTSWKTRLLACCRPGHGALSPADAASAWRHGVRLGVHCCRCCAGPTTALLVVGVMDLRAMALAMAAIAGERLLPMGERIARGAGAAAIGAGAWLIARALP
jgi:predicted metal-binding membrane protein